MKEPLYSTDISDFHNVTLNQFLKEFREFIKSNKFSLFIGALTVLFVYGIRLANNNIGIDTVRALDYLNRDAHLTSGRFGITLLMKVFAVHNYNLFAINLTAEILLLLGAVLWCFFLNRISAKKCNNFQNSIFLIIYIASEVWVEMLYFSLSSVEITMSLFLCPICVYCFYRFVLFGKRSDFFCSVFFLTLFFSVYPGVVLFFLSGALAYYIVIETGRNTVFRFGELLKKGIGIGLLSAVLYLIINFSVKKILDIHSDYVESFFQISFNKKAIMEWFLYIYSYFFGNVKLLSKLVDPIVAAHARSGQTAVDWYHNSFFGVSNILFFPATIYFIWKNIRDKKIIKLLCAVLLVLSMFLFPLLGGGHCPMRSNYALPIVSAFLMWDFCGYIGNINNKKIILAVEIIVFFIISRQVQNNALINYSDQRRYEADVALTREIDMNIKNMGYNDGDGIKNILFVGRYSPELVNLQKGELSGSSLFVNANGYVISLMRVLGMNYTYPIDFDENKYDSFIKKMPSYPQEGYLGEVDNIIFVKLSDEIETDVIEGE